MQTDVLCNCSEYVNQWGQKVNECWQATPNPDSSFHFENWPVWGQILTFLVGVGLFVLLVFLVLSAVDGVLNYLKNLKTKADWTYSTTSEIRSEIWKIQNKIDEKKGKKR